MRCIADLLAGAHNAANWHLLQALGAASFDVATRGTTLAFVNTLKKLRQPLSRSL